MKPRIKLYLGLFSILLIATCVTIFELFFYIYVVEPTVNGEIASLLKHITQESFDKTIDSIFDVFISRENIIMNDINFGSYLIIVFEIIFLFVILCYLVLLIKKTSTTYNVEYHFKPVIIHSAIVIFILIAFQIVFFQFSYNYYYIGRFGLDEIKARTILKLKDYFE